MKYKIGDVSKILGISTDLLRYYEKKGVVTPEKNESNDYRYYDSWHINYLLDCLWFKNFGFSIEQIADMVRIPRLGELEEIFENKEDELRATIRRCELLLRRSERHRSDLQRIESLLYKCEVCENPEMVVYINRYGDRYAAEGGVEYARRWLSVMPFNRRYFRMTPEAEEGYLWGFSLETDYAKELGFDAEAPMTVVHAQKCLHTVFKSRGDKGGFDPGLVSYMEEYAREHGLRVTGSVFGCLLASVMEEDKLTGYFEAWLPVE